MLLLRPIKEHKNREHCVYLKKKTDARVLEYKKKMIELLRQ